MKLRWVLDTNIIFSGIISTDSTPQKVLESTLEEGEPIPVLSQEILNEYETVLRRKGEKYGILDSDRIFY